MNKILLATLVSITFSVQGQAPDWNLSPKSDTVVITGKISIDVKPKSSVVQFFAIDHLKKQQGSYFSVLDSAGNFHARFFLRNTQDISWSFSESPIFHRLLLSPGDSLNINVNESGFEFSGDHAKPCEDIHNMRTPDEDMQYYFDRNKGLSLEPEEYLTFRKKSYDEDARWLDRYCRERDCSQLFIEWYKNDNEVRYYWDLLSFSYKSLNYGLGSLVRLQGERKHKYDSSFWSSMRPSYPGYTLSSRFFALVNDYSLRYTRNSMDQNDAQKLKLNRLAEILSRKVTSEGNKVGTMELNLIKEMQLKSHYDEPIDTAVLRVYWKISERYDTELKMMERSFWIEKYTSGLSSIEDSNIADIALVQAFFQGQEASDEVDPFFNTIYPKLTGSQYKAIVKAEYEKAKTTQSDMKVDTDGISFIPVDFEKTGDQLLSSIIKLNPGKHMLLDFWATWCSPCRSDFVRMRSLKTKLPSDSISYVYLCSQSIKEEWVKVVKKMDIKGQHYFVSQLQYDDLQKKLNISGFPSYFVLDTNGKIYKEFDLHDEGQFLERVLRVMKK